MPSQPQQLTTQEAALRISLKANKAWHQLTEENIISLRQEYRRIIEAGTRLITGYDSELKDIRRGINAIESITPFQEDHTSIIHKREALEEAKSILLKYGLPFPMPTSQRELRDLKEQWPGLKTKRRAIIRQEMCRRLSLPLNTAWEKVRNMDSSSHTFKCGICSRCGVSDRAAQQFGWKTCQPIVSSTTKQTFNQTDTSAEGRQKQPSSLEDEINILYKRRLSTLDPPTQARLDTQNWRDYSNTLSDSGSNIQEQGISIIDIRIAIEKRTKGLKTIEEASQLKRELEEALASSTDEKQRSHYRTGDKMSNGKILISRGMKERLQVKIRHCEAAIKSFVEIKANKPEKKSEEVSSRPAELKLPAYADQSLVDELWKELSNIESPTGYLYLKRWVKGESAWYKLGITSNPKRRDSEQNVLPVPAETLFCYDVGSIDRARTIESIIKRVLDSHKIRGSQNRELFHLSEEQVSALMAAMNAIDAL